MSPKTTKTELTTARLRLRWLTERDAALMLAIWNDPDFILHVGDRGIRTPVQAEQALRDGILTLYAKHHHGPFLAESLDGGPPMGICGLFKRDNLDAPDIGYGFLPAFRGSGYAVEAARAVLAYAREDLGLTKLLAIVSAANGRSIQLLSKLGMYPERTLRMPGEDEDVMLFSIEFSQS